MSYLFGKKSLKNLETCHKDIQAILNEVIKYYDFSVISGIRTTEEQQTLFKEGKSKLDGVNQKSKHQGREDDAGNIVSFAVDICPYKPGTNAFSGKELDTRRFYYLMGMVKATAKRLKDQGVISYDVRFGIDWDGDDVFSDQNFHDAPHFELVEIK
jgi:hypothetical protein